MTVDPHQPPLRWSAVVLAAGKGTRMRSPLPKVLHRAAGQALIDHVLATARQLLPAEAITVVVGHCAEQVRGHLAGSDVHTVLQEPQLGTGHALQVALEGMGETAGDAVVVLSGDVPLLRPETVNGLRELVDGGAAAALLTARLDQPGAYGRVVRDDHGLVAAVVEAGDADAATLAVNEVNAGVYAFRTAAVHSALGGLDRDNVQGEYYLTDVVAAIRAAGQPVAALCLADASEMQGVNTVAQLAEVERVLTARAHVAKRPLE
jgi:bifunctional UDP-N-acetylglucosamine pyrophosphorylase/glucosamine-1-phosphate N-acetyltransferase